MPDHSRRLPSQLGCWHSRHTPTSQKAPRVAALCLKAHFCASASDSTTSPIANSPSPSTEQPVRIAGTEAAGTDAASVCGSETNQPHAKEISQKLKAPLGEDRRSVSRPSYLVCSA